MKRFTKFLSVVLFVSFATSALASGFGLLKNGSKSGETGDVLVVNHTNYNLQVYYKYDSSEKPGYQPIGSYSQIIIPGSPNPGDYQVCYHITYYDGTPIEQGADGCLAAGTVDIGYYGLQKKLTASVVH